MAVPNLLTNATLKVETEVLAVTTTITAIVGAVTSGETWFVDLNVANIHASNAGAITVTKYNGSTDYVLVNALGIPVGQALTMKRIHLEEGWSLRLDADASSVFTGVADVEKWS